MKMALIVTLALSLAGCARMASSQAGGTIAYEERTYGRSHGPTRIQHLEGILHRKPVCCGVIDNQTRELSLSIHEPQPWGLPDEPLHITHASDLWRLRKRRIGYLNLFLIRHDAHGKPARIIWRQLGENGDMRPSKPDLLKHARPGDLILGMRGF